MNLPQLLEQTFVQRVDWQASVPSTNSVALQSTNVVDDLPWLIGANEQTQGRGRGKNSWWACSGSLTFSLVHRPSDSGIVKRQWPQISLTVGLAVTEMVSELLPGHCVQLKWPNDVYVDGRKIAGILIETMPQHDDLVVTGIGMNLNNSLADAPHEIQDTAIAACDVVGEMLDPTRAMVSLLNHLDRELRLLGEEDPTLSERLRERCFLTGKTVTISNSGSDVTGTCDGIDDDGALRITTPSGPKRFHSGTVTVQE